MMFNPIDVVQVHFSANVNYIPEGVAHDEVLLKKGFIFGMTKV